MYKPNTNLTIFASLTEKYEFQRSSGSDDDEKNYGFKRGDDVLSWFYRNELPLPEDQLKHLQKGITDNETVAQVSVTIKYTVEFAQTLGVPMKWGMHHVALWTIKV